MKRWTCRQVLECASPLALWRCQKRSRRVRSALQDAVALAKTPFGAWPPTRFRSLGLEASMNFATVPQRRMIPPITLSNESESPSAPRDGTATKAKELDSARVFRNSGRTAYEWAWRGCRDFRGSAHSIWSSRRWTSARLPSGNRMVKRFP
jgi:hypothetical protein